MKIKKIMIISSLLIVILCTFALIYNHKQLPTTNNVFDLTKNWSPSTEKVYLVRKMDGEWFTVFRNKHSLMVGKLKRNWFGSWELIDELGGQGSLTSTYYPSQKDDGINWSAGGVEGIFYYFGQVIDPYIRKVKIETHENSYENVPIINTDGNRFFIKKVEGKEVLPINIRGLSKSGELLFSSKGQL